jgi:hypothetical protein
MNRFLTWLDVRRRILQETRRDRELKNKGIVRVNCFSDAVEIGITGDKESAKSIVKQWFGDWYLEEESVIQLDMGDDTALCATNWYSSSRKIILELLAGA